MTVVQLPDIDDLILNLEEGAQPVTVRGVPGLAGSQVFIGDQEVRGLREIRWVHEAGKPPVVELRIVAKAHVNVDAHTEQVSWGGLEEVHTAALYEELQRRQSEATHDG